MSVFAGDIDFKTVYMVDYYEKHPLQTGRQRQRERQRRGQRRGDSGPFSTPVGSGASCRGFIQTQYFLSCRRNRCPCRCPRRCRSRCRRRCRPACSLIPLYVQDYFINAVSNRYPKPAKSKYEDDHCLIVGISRDTLKHKEGLKDPPDVLCPCEREHYKEAVKRFEQDIPKLTKMYMSKEVDPEVMDYHINDVKRTEYVAEYCTKDYQFQSKRVGEGADGQQTFTLADEANLPDTIYKSSYRAPKPEKYKEPIAEVSTKPTYDDSLQKKLREICRVKTGETVYQVNHSLLGKVIIEQQPYGPGRTEPKYGRWKNPYYYTYRIN